MNIKKISWIDGNYDLESDKEQVIIEQDWGNKGLGGIVVVLCLLAVLLPAIPISLQLLKGTAKGNPVGALIAIFVIFSWPLYWGLNQFFFKRYIKICNKVVKFELISILKKKKYEVKIRDYKQIEFGKSEGYARTDSSPRVTSRYFVRLPHKDRKKAINLYENIQKPMSEDRMLNYSKKLNLPLINVTQEQTN